MLAGAACATLIGVALPATAATSPELPTAASYNGAADRAVDAFNASRAGAPLWLKNGAAAREMIDTAGARLYMIEDGRIADSMKVIVGKSDPSTQTPMIASTIYYATLNPYWHVSGEILRSTIARNVLDQGLGYLKARGYQVLAADGSGELLDPAQVDWSAVAAGRETVPVRQLPGPANSMGQMKIPFPNGSDIYLHDTPNKDLFAQDDRLLSHGCIRLEDADRLGRWLMGREPQAA